MIAHAGLGAGLPDSRTPAVGATKVAGQRLFTVRVAMRQRPPMDDNATYRCRLMRVTR